ncbi:MAG: SUMF1/EgtB/PvdO family nonheme iron enzyme, partial [Gammaproteobacteria bacterium]|nr:SUMF1/EgtB/PvdO family nonheme iron enzyme [Gammaproteobacteria bacterium]NIT15238.1 SUMF1/EgtB/PvdO family nonheme iron enzyme [Gammaproteobacteria bacterium]
MDEHLLRLLEDRDDAPTAVIELGLNHEQQHQELMLTDIKHVLSCNPLLPAYDPDLPVAEARAAPSHTFIDGASGIHLVGADGDGFRFDNETPRHEALLQEHRIGSRPVTNGEFRKFVADGGYRDSTLWLSDGWATVNQEGWDRPLYWSEDLQTEFTLGGLR